MQLDFLRALYERPSGEFGSRYVSVYLDTTATSADAATEVSLRWRAARERLADRVDAATLEAVEVTVTRREHEVRGRVIFARGGAVLLEGAMPQPPAQQIVSLTPLPHVMPWLRQLPRHVPHVRVVAMKTGGQVVAVPGQVAVVPAQRTAERTTVQGETWPVHKVSTGGWSEQRLQRSTEETWAANAKRVARAAVAEAERVHAEFVLVGGDVRERSMVLDELPSRLHETAVTVDREVGPDDEPFEAEARAEEDRRADRERRGLLEELGTRMRSPGERRAVTGLADTCVALRDGLASDVLLLGEPSWQADAIWIGPGLADIATERDALAQRGTSLLQDRADAALVRAITGTDAELHLLPAEADPERGSAPGDPASAVRDGIAALLRAPAAAL